MEVEPGQEVQVDFGQGAWVLINGKGKRPHLFRLGLLLVGMPSGRRSKVWSQSLRACPQSFMS